MQDGKVRRRQRLIYSALLIGMIWGGLFSILSAQSSNRAIAHDHASYAQDDVPATITALYAQLQAIDATKTAIAQATPATATQTATASSTRTRPPTHTPLPPPTPTRTPTPTATATATRVIAVANVLVPTLNMRSGPGTNFPIITRSQAGDIFPIVSQVEDCAWLQVVLENGEQVWISGSAAFTQMNVACTQVPVLPATLAADLSRPTPTPRNAGQLQPSPTSAQLRNTPTLTPTSTPRQETSGPTTVRIDAPVDNVSVADIATFAWTPDRPLAPGQVFELAFWQPNETWNAGRSLTGASDKSTVEIRVGNLGSGTYVWGVILGAFDPNSGAYQRLRFLGGNRTIVVGGGGSNHADSDDNNPDNPDNPHAGEK